jgi:hypothetical protein
MDRMEHGLTMVYNRIPDNAQETKKSIEEKINLIAKTIDQYIHDIVELKERINLMTPPEVREQRKQEVAIQITEIEKQESVAEEMFDRVAQLWTMLEEDE